MYVKLNVQYLCLLIIIPHNTHTNKHFLPATSHAVRGRIRVPGVWQPLPPDVREPGLRRPRLLR